MERGRHERMNGKALFTITKFDSFVGTLLVVPPSGIVMKISLANKSSI